MSHSPSSISTSMPAAGRSVEEQCREDLAAGDSERVLSTLMRGYGRDLHRYCWGMLRQKQLAEDILQTVFVQAHEGLSARHPPSTFRGWLFAIARHRCLDELRRRRRWNRLLDHRQADAELACEAPGGDHDAEDATLNAHLQQCLGALSDPSRELVLLRFQQELSYEEIATTAGASAGALRVRVCRALTALRRCLEQKGASI
jgi:RNA polymerase sigma factor (sigma-70 family)